MSLNDQSSNEIARDLILEEKPEPKTPQRFSKRKATTSVTPDAGADNDNAAAGTVVRKRTRLRGRLSLMMEMPVDIFTEVMWLCNLSLARLTCLLDCLPSYSSRSSPLVKVNEKIARTADV